MSTLDPTSATDTILPVPPRVSLPDSVLNAYITSLRLLFTAWLTHFRSLGYIKDSTLDMLDRTVCKKSVELTVRDYKAREVIGGSEQIWTDLVELFRVANPSLEQRSYGPGDPLNPNADGPSSNVIVANNITLLKDLQRLDNVLSMARNVLTAGQKAQNLAAQVGFDREVCAMVNLCVKITARGFDGDGTNIEEDKWQGVINGFKKLLITCLQFLSNLVTMNERLKLMLWTELFDSSARPPPLDASEPTSAAQDLARATDKWVLGATRAFVNNGEAELEEPKPPRLPNAKPKLPMTPYFLFVSENRAKIKAQLSLRTDPTSKQVMQEGTRRWNLMSEKEKQVWRQAYNDRLTKYKKDVDAWEAAGRPEFLAGEGAPSIVEGVVENTAAFDGPKQDGEQSNETRAFTNPPQSNLPTSNGVLKPRPSRMLETSLFTNEYDLNKAEQANLAFDNSVKRIVSAEEGNRRLEEGKQQLMKRLETPSHAVHPSSTGTVLNEEGIHEHEIDSGGEEERDEELDEELDEEDEDDLDEEEDYDEEDESELEESSDEEQFAIPGEDGRGLLTDVPLILGPNEIEVLPMIIMSGIVPPKDEQYVLDYPKALTQPIGAFTNLYIVRCHLLLAQENGRNLLRELLIFVAAWDLRDEELYFKFMVKIMEAILMVGLMPFAYVAFKESKDIISPAQAVIMKLLTKIFHFRQAFTDRDPTNTRSIEEDSAKLSGPQLQMTFDIQVVHTLFNEFRAHIIPQICALIYLQGQIRGGKAHLEDFPLNLWDMERMYEGVYQYLEFFAILTDHDRWKQMMADWEVTNELVTLLRELENAIPKGRMVGPPPPLSQINRNNPHVATPSPELPGDAVSPQPSETANQQPTPVAVERPYDINNNITEPLDPNPDHDIPQAAGVSPYPEPIHDEPADFEWRNLKKLCVLVLSSLVWKNRRLQDQVRSFGGIKVILSSCSYDEHNPYIREHAIMCLRFLLEGNKENQKTIRKLAEMSETTGVTVPAEVLDHHGYETFMDGKGQVGLRRKEVPGVLKVLHAGEDVKDIWGVAAGASWPEWMQMLMKRKSETR